MLLREIAQRLSKAVRGEDTVARFGGDEFVVIAPVTEAADAADVAQTILRAIETPATAGGHE